MTNWDLFLECKNDSTYKNQCNIPLEQNEGKSHMIISIGVEKAYDKIQHHACHDKKKSSTN